MKILFLDVDGVLNCQESWPHDSPTNTPLDPDKVALLNEVTASTGALIVVSSTWRLLCEGTPLLAAGAIGKGEDCRSILRAGGLTGEFHPDWSTPRASRFSGCRGHEIDEWLEDHPEARPFAIVDDNSDMLQIQLPYFVQTTWERGMQAEHARRLIEILGAT